MTCEAGKTKETYSGENNKPLNQSCKNRVKRIDFRGIAEVDKTQNITSHTYM